MEPRWYSLWYSGKFRSLKNIWQQWHERVAEFFDRSEMSITHFGARSPSFHSGKYLQYPRSRTRLLKALENGEDFHHLSFLEMRSGPFDTLAGDNSFHVAMAHNSVEADVRLDHYEQDLCDSFRSVAEDFFRSARLITFRTPAEIRAIGCLPFNFPANYGNEIAAEYIDIQVAHIGSKTG